MPSYRDFLTMEVDKKVGQPDVNCFKYQPDEKLHTRSDYSPESERNSSNPSPPESSNLNINLYQRKGRAYSKDLCRANSIKKPMKTQEYYSPGSFTGSMNRTNSPSEKSFMKMGQENTPCKQQIRIGLKPSERISYLREILPLQNHSGYTTRSKWELMASPKAPLRRPNSPSSHLIW